MANYIDIDEHFRFFGASLARILARYGDVPEDKVLENQRRQIETLAKLEVDFRERLVRCREGAGAYRDFVRYICEERRNILAARPYFRERQGVFTKKISVALKRRQADALYKFHFNFQFVSFVVNGPLDCPDIRPRRLPRELYRIADRIVAMRTEIVETNLPLAINRASIFWRRTRQVRQQYMDLVQTCGEGLIAAVDKFCLPFSPVWRSVAIGRMVGNLIEESSSTFVHFFPADKRKLYRARKAAGRLTFDEIDFESLAREVNRKEIDTKKDRQRKVDKSQLTTATELAGLMAATNCVSADASPPHGEGGDAQDLGPAIDRYEAAPEWRPDVQFEEHEAQAVVARAVLQLSVLDRKVLQLRGMAA